MKNIILSAVILFLFVFAGGAAVAQESKGPVTLKQAMALDKNGKHDEAVAAIKQIIAQDTKQDKSIAHMLLGIVYFKDGDYEDALASFSKSIEINKENPMSYYFTGMIYEKKALAASNFVKMKDMKTRALQSWEQYLAAVNNKKISPESHRNVGMTIAVGIKRAKKHIEVLKEGLKNE